MSFAGRGCRASGFGFQVSDFEFWVPGLGFMVDSLRGVPAAPPGAYRGTSLSRKRTTLGPYRRPLPRVLGGS